MEERIKQLLEMERLTPAEFADRIKIQRPSVSHVLSGRNKPGYVFIQKILQGFPTLSARWLLNGEGPVFEDQMIPEKQGKPSPDLFSQTDVRVSAQSPAQEKEDHSLTNLIEPEKERTSGNESDFASQIEKTIRFPVNSSKKAERIVIFYTDKTFEEYYPSL